MTLDAIYRYPVKSLAGEAVETAALTALGVPGDRIVHVRGPEGVRSARRQYRLLGLHGTLDADGVPRINGHLWHRPEALMLVQGEAGADAWLEAYDGPDRFDVLPLLVATDGALAAFGRDVRRLRPIWSSAASTEWMSSAGPGPNCISARRSWVSTRGADGVR